MKKLLLTGAALMALSLSVKAQSLYSQGFNSLTVGNVGTDLTGMTAGQGGTFTYVVAGGANSDFQIIADGKEGNAFQITGGSTPTGTTQATSNVRYAWADGLADAWGAREEGNEIIAAEYYFNAATVAGSTSFHRTALYSSEGFVMGGYSYNASTGELEGLIYYSDNGGTPATYRIGLTEDTLLLPNNEWVKLGFAIDPSTGTVIWVSPDILVENAETGEMEELYGGIVSAVTVGFEPAEFDFLSIPGTANAASSYAKYDRVTVDAVTDLAEWLSTGKPVVADKLSVYPNPANNVINVAGASTLVSNVSIADLNGRVVKAAKFDGVANAQVNISDLASGVYMMTIASDKGTTTKKIVKN